MPYGNAYQWGPLTVGPLMPENLPGPLGQAFSGYQNAPFSTVQVNPMDSILSGLNHAGGGPFGFDPVGNWLQHSFPQAFANTPIGRDTATLMGPTGPLGRVGDVLIGASRYLGAPDAAHGGPMLTSEEYPPQAPAPPPVTTHDQGGNVDPMADLMKEMLGGQTTTVHIPAPPAFHPGQGPDYTKTLQMLDAGAPTDIGPPTHSDQLNARDKQLMVLGAIADAGYNPHMSLGQNILNLGIASLGGPGRYRAAELAQNREYDKEDYAHREQLARDKNVYNIERARVYEGMAKDESAVQRENTRDQALMDRELWQMLMPKVSDNTLTQYQKNPDGSYTGTTSRLYDPMKRFQMAALMSMAPATDVAMSVMRGNIPGVTSDQQAALSTVEADLHAYAMPLLQKAMRELGINGKEVSVADAMTWISPQLNQYLMQKYPQLYDAIGKRIQKETFMKLFTGSGEASHILNEKTP